MEIIFYFVLFVWSFVCLIVALFHHDQDAVYIFVVLFPLMFMTLMDNLYSTKFYFLVFG